MLFNQLTLCGSTRQQKLYEYSINVLQVSEPPEGYYLCTSFGKDSIAVQRLCDEAGVKYDAHHNITGIDPPELVYFGRKYYPEVERRMYKKSMWKLIEHKKFLPLRNLRFCCESLKKNGGKGRTCVLGIRAAESTSRAKRAPVETLSSNKEKRVHIFVPDDINQVLQRSNGCMGIRAVAVELYKAIALLEDIEKAFNYLDGGLTEEVNLRSVLDEAREKCITGNR